MANTPILWPALDSDCDTAAIIASVNPAIVRECVRTEDLGMWATQPNPGLTQQRQPGKSNKLQNQKIG